MGVMRIAQVLMFCSAAGGTSTAQAQVPGRCETPVEKRDGEAGCYLSATQHLGALPEGEVFWHLHVYPTRAAAESAKGPRATVVEAFGKVWLYSIADSQWRASDGEHVASICPLPVTAGKQYVARYMEAVFPPGMKAAIHRHSGPEAWYLVSGAQCLETPEGITVARAGEGAIVRAGPPMVLSSVGTETRRSVLLVLHDQSHPWITMASDWKPQDRCPN